MFFFMGCSLLFIEFLAVFPALRLFGIWNSFLQDVQAARKFIEEKEAAQRRRKEVYHHNVLSVHM